MKTITQQEILEEIQKTLVRGPTVGMTSGEIREAMGWARDRTQSILKRLVAEGKLTATFGLRPNVMGFDVRVPVYQIRKKK